MFRKVSRCLSSTVKEFIGQPTPLTHPHLLKEGEITVGIQRDDFKQRRNVLLSALQPGAMLVLNAYETRIMTHDIPWRFRQESNFWFLTGCLEPNACAIFQKSPEGETSWSLFIRKKDPVKEMWDGVQTGQVLGLKHFDPDACYERSDVARIIRESINEKKTSSIMMLKNINIPAEEEVKAVVGTFTDPKQILLALRTVKGESQINMHRRSASITKDMFTAAMMSTAPGVSESTIESIMNFVTQLQGGDRLAYPPVVAGGDNGLALHYVANNTILKDGDLVLVDAGAEFANHPTDVTRTWPVNGVYSPNQRRVYTAVLNVQKQLIAALQVGETITKLQRLSEELITEALLELGVLSGNAATHREKGSYKKYYQHAFGHPFGLDIHETFPTLCQDKFLAKAIHTVEPGIYLPNSSDVPEDLRGICVRIEDDVLLTNDGGEVLTASIPKEIDEIEHLMSNSSDKSNDLLSQFGINNNI